jgi:hypothetical protein
VSYMPTSSTNKIRQTNGSNYYVNGSSGNDSNDGLTPSTAVATIGAAIALLSAGDNIIVAGGTYAEDGLDLNVSNTSMHCECGVTIAPSSGTALTISGAYCCVDGELMITAVAGQVGVLVSGAHCELEHIQVSGGANGFQITAINAELHYCRSGSPTTAGFDIQAGQQKLYNCGTIGAGGSTYGYNINNSADKGLLVGCTSVDHGTSGFNFATGSSAWTVLNCSSGRGDGKWNDVDDQNVWIDFGYDEWRYAEMTLDANNTTKSYNIFEVVGIIEIEEIYGHVTTALSADNTACYLGLIADGAEVEITDGAGADLSSAPVGSLVARTEGAGTILNYKSSANVFLTESTNFRSPKTSFIVGQKAGTTSYIRFTHTTTDTPSSGEIHWHVKWKPITDDGILKGV